MEIPRTETGKPEAHRLRRQFVAVQLCKAALGVLLCAGFIALIGRPVPAEMVAMAGLIAPAFLALLTLTKIRLVTLEQAALVIFAALVGWMAALTGGVLSPLVVWFALIPAEAALSGGRPTVWRAALAATVALAALTLLQGLGSLPQAQLALPPFTLYAGSIFVAIVQAALVAAAAQDRQHAADQAAAEGAAMYRFLADNAMDLITRHSSDGRIRFASPAALTLLEMEPASLEGLAPTALCHGDDLKTMQAAFMEACYFGRSATAEVRLKKAGGSLVWAEIRCRPVPRAHGDGADIVAVTRDITERKAHERELIEARDLAEEANRAKSRFLANMSHELRTPLNAIIGFSEVMMQEMFGPLGSTRYVEYSRLVHESGNHLLELINGVLDMSKIEAGKFELAEEVFDFSAVAEASVRFLKLPAERAGVALRTQVAQTAQYVFADKRAIKQILVNLLSNGVKFTPKGGEVAIRAALDSRGIEIAVSDTGVGIPEKDLMRLGQPFEQVEGEHVRKKEGTGLGLSLVKALAGMHGGEATIESVFGVGTTVRVRLPYAAVGENGERIAPEDSKIIPFRSGAAA